MLSPKRLLFSLVFCVAVGILVFGEARINAQVSSTASLDVADELREREIDFEKKDFHGFAQFEFKLEGVACKIVQPKQSAEGQPWIWRARFWGHEPQLDLALLEQGWSVCYCDVAGLFGNDEAVKRWDGFYELSQKMSLGSKPFLEGMSRGGLIITRWAAANPKQVAGIYADNAVLDFCSWPGGKGSGKGSEPAWRKCLKAYQLTEVEAKAFDDGPLNQLQPLVEADVPIVVLINEADDVVPPAENGDLLVARYKELGGRIMEIRRPGLGHHPHSLKDPAELVEFVLKAHRNEDFESK